MNRKHLISDIQISAIRSELKHIMGNTIHTPDTAASYEKVLDLLKIVSGE